MTVATRNNELRDHVFAACDLILQRGERVSFDNVKKEIGEERSLGSIYPFIQEWRDAKDAGEKGLPFGVLRALREGQAALRQIEATMIATWSSAINSADPSAAKNCSPIASTQRVNSLLLAEYIARSMPVDIDLSFELETVASYCDQLHQNGATLESLAYALRSKKRGS